MAQYDSVTGDKQLEADTINANWRERQANKTEETVKKLNNNKSVGAFAQTRESYLQAVSNESENSGLPPVWKTMDLTKFIAEDVQKAINKIKDTCDQVIAIADAIVAIAKFYGQVLGALASIIETLINTIRNEIKDILDSLVAAGGVYVLYIPADFKNGGGIDYYKKTFLDSLEDTKDTRRPKIKNTHEASALFLTVGGLSYGFLGDWLDRMADFFFGAENKSSLAVSRGVVIPAPDKFVVSPRFAPVWKTPVVQDLLYEMPREQGVLEATLRSVESRLSFTEKSMALHGVCDWEVPDSIDFKPRITFETEDKLSFYTVNEYRENKNGSTWEFIWEEAVVSKYMIIRTPTAKEINDICNNKELLQKALTQGGIGPGEEGLGEHSEIIVGDLVPGFHWYSDTGILPPDSAQVQNSLGNIPVPEGPASKNYRNKEYRYRMYFAGHKFTYKQKYVATGAGSFDVYYSSGDPKAPYSSSADTSVEVDDIAEIAADDLQYLKNCEPILDVDASGNQLWILSEPTRTVEISNTSIQAPGGGTAPNWYSFQLIDLLPPLKALIEKAKVLVDQIADSLIEGLNAIVEWVEAQIAYLEKIARLIKELMELIKSLLIPPMFGVHSLTIQTNRGLEGIKRQLEMSFNGAPKSSTGEKDYPDEYLMFGSRVPVSGRMVDVGSSAYAGLLGPGPVTGLSAQQGYAAFAESRNTLFGGDDDRGKRKGAPSDEDMRRLGIPIYDRNHFTGGFVFIFEKIATFQAFIRLLNLEAFISQETEKAKKEMIGKIDFDRVHKPSLSYNKPKSRNERLAERLSASLQARYYDDEAVRAESDHRMGISPPRAGAAENSNDRVANTDADGRKYVITGASEPFTFDPVPTVLVFVVNGVEVIVLIATPSLNAKQLANKINAAVKAATGVDLVQAVDGKLVFGTPPATFGDRSRTILVGASSYELDSTLKPGTKLTGLDLDAEKKTQGNTFAYRTGDLLVEVQEFGVPTFEMLRAVPAVFDYNPFVADPEIQDFAPDRCRLRIKVDGLPTQLIDVTGNNGSNPVDAPPQLFLRGAGGGDIGLPLRVRPGEQKFRIELQGAFVRLANTTGCTLTDFTTVSKTGFDFTAAGVRVGDMAYFEAELGDTFKSEVVGVGEESFTISECAFYNLNNLKILKVVRGGLPSTINGNQVIQYVASLDINEDPETSQVYNNINELSQAMGLAIGNAGFGIGNITVKPVDTSAEKNGSTGYLVVYPGDWGIGDDVRLKIWEPPYTGAAAGLITNDLSASFPLLVDKAKSTILVELFGEASEPEDFQEISIPEGTYDTVEDLAAAINNGLVAAGYQDFIARADDNSLVFQIDPTSGGQVLARHYGYSSRVGIRVKTGRPLTQLDTTESFTPGVSQPPMIVTPELNFPFYVKTGYADAFQLVVNGYVAPVVIKPGVYNNNSALRDAVANALLEAGVHTVRVETSGVSQLRFVMIPGDPDRVGNGASLALLNGRSTLPALTAPAVSISEMRDYAYQRIYGWLIDHPLEYPVPPFDDPAPLAFEASSYGVTDEPYDGTWEIVANVNNRFEIMIDAPRGDIPAGWQTVTVTPGTYVSFGLLVTEINTRVAGIYGTGMIAVTDIGDDQMAFDLVDADLKGAFVQLSLQQFTDRDFAAFGSQTGGALLRDAVGTGDRRFLEIIGMTDTVAFGSDDLFTWLGVMNGIGNVDEYGVPYLEAVGADDYNLLRILGTPAVERAGSYKIPYTLQEVVTNINAHFAGVDVAYKDVASAYYDTGRIRLEGRHKGQNGLIEITAVADPEIADSLEFSEVAGLCFGFDPAGRSEHIIIRGIGSEPRCKELEIVNEGVELLIARVDSEYQLAVESAVEYETVIETYDPLGYITELAAA